MTDLEEYLTLVADDRVPDKARILRVRQLTRRLSDRPGVAAGAAKYLNDCYLTLQFAVIANDHELIRSSRRRCIAVVRRIAG
jgi:hypothetical protein